MSSHEMKEINMICTSFPTILLTKYIQNAQMVGKNLTISDEI